MGFGTTLFTLDIFYLVAVSSTVYLKILSDLAFKSHLAQPVDVR